MNRTNLTLSLLPDNYSICRLGPAADIPPWALAGNFFSITRTEEELSLVCSQEVVPDGVQCEKGWRCVMVVGPLDFSLTGILASLTASLARITSYNVCYTKLLRSGQGSQYSSQGKVQGTYHHDAAPAFFIV